MTNITGLNPTFYESLTPDLAKTAKVFNLPTILQRNRYVTLGG
jgi:hypothetical protein